jgi:transcriptional regulator with XRE-family HTH domain
MNSKVQILGKFAKNLKTLRTNRKLSLRELAYRSDLEYSHVQRIEKGKVNFAFSTLIALAEGLDITPAELLNY